MTRVVLMCAIQGWRFRPAIQRRFQDDRTADDSTPPPAERAGLPIGRRLDAGIHVWGLPFGRTIRARSGELRLVGPLLLYLLPPSKRVSATFRRSTGHNRDTVRGAVSLSAQSARGKMIFSWAMTGSTSGSPVVACQYFGPTVPFSFRSSTQST